MISKDHFGMLTAILKSPETSQRVLSEKLGISLGKTNSILKELRSQGLVSENACKLTESGLKALEPFKVKNAIIMAAGMSSRFAPLSYELPKALLKVKGDRLIEREIEQLQEAGIDDITIVVGYMKEKLFYLEDKYNVKIVINSDYYRYNNTSTLILVADKLENTYICSSDNYFAENPFEPYVYKAYYAAEYDPGKTDEYCIKTDRSGRITAVTHGGRASWFMIGHVYFDREFSKNFVRILKEEYEKPITKEQLWEDLYIRYIKDLDMVIRKYSSDMIKEFDSLDELRQFDPKYISNAGSKIFDNICSVLKCRESDICNIHPIKTGLTNLSFLFSCTCPEKEGDYVYRHPGVGTENYINREAEARSMEIAKTLKLDDTFIYIDPKEGWKISHFIPNAKTLDYHNAEHVARSMEMLRTLHGSGLTSSYSFDVWTEIEKFEKAIKNFNRHDFSDAGELKDGIEKLHGYVEADGVEKCICHCDSYDPNFLIDEEGKMYLIDWEYSGMADPGCDIGTFLACSDYTLKEAESLIGTYIGKTPKTSQKRHFMAYGAILSYYWFIWALYQESLGKPVGEWLYLWYKHTKMYSKEAVRLYEDAE